MKPSQRGEPQTRAALSDCEPLFFYYTLNANGNNPEKKSEKVIYKSKCKIYEAQKHSRVLSPLRRNFWEDFDRKACAVIKSRLKNIDICVKTPLKNIYFSFILKIFFSCDEFRNMVPFQLSLNKQTAKNLSAIKYDHSLYNVNVPGTDRTVIPRQTAADDLISYEYMNELRNYD